MYVDLIQLEDEIDEFLLDFGFQVVDLHYGGTGPNKVFRLFVDQIDGTPVTISDCSSLARQVILFLEARDLYNDRTSLEVSSAGLDRILKRSRDFERFLGSEVKATFHTDDRRETIRGELASFTDDYLLITMSAADARKTGSGEPDTAESTSVRIKRGNLDKVSLIPQLEF